MARHLLIPLVLVICSITLVGCESGESKLAEIGDSFHDSVDQAVKKTTKVVGESVDGLEVEKWGASKMAQEEFNKLYAFEYHVESIFLPTNAADLQLRLNELGNDKWECGNPIPGLTERSPFLATPVPNPDRLPEFQALIICKRRPASYLRMLNRLGP